MSAQRRLNSVASHLSGSAQAQVLTADCAAFADVKIAPPNEIFHTKAMYLKDTDPRKVDLGIGAYRDNNGKPVVLSSVKKAEHIVVNDTKMDHEYLPITGDAEFATLSQEMLFGASSAPVKEKRVASVHCLSGTGALRVGFDFLGRFMSSSTVYISEPTWENHAEICKVAGLKSTTYRYWDAKNRKLDFPGLMADLKAAPAKSIILLHGCAHNPTGVDPTQDQWKSIAALCKERDLFPFFDIAYQGFASGDLDRDAWSLRHFVEQGLEVVAAQSFAKNFGLYSERTGCFHVCAKAARDAQACASQIALLVRPNYSNPPAFGARIVKTILKTPELLALWKSELAAMSDRINSMRKALYGELKALGTPGTWEHIITQIGMFTFTGLNLNQVNSLVTKHHVYLLKSGRISMAGINEGNVKYLAKCIDEVVRTVQ